MDSDTPFYEVNIRGKLGNISLLPGRGRGRGIRGRNVGVGYSEDVLKSLDEVVEKRGILKPPSWNKSNDDDLPITGKNAKKLADCGALSSTGSASIRLNEHLDPRSCGLDELIQDRSGEKSARRSFVPGNQRNKILRFQDEAEEKVDSPDGVAKMFKRQTYKDHKAGGGKSEGPERSKVVEDEVEEKVDSPDGVGKMFKRPAHLDPMSTSLDEIIREGLGRKSGANSSPNNSSPEKAKESFPEKIKLRSNVDPCSSSLDAMIVKEKPTKEGTRMKRAFEDDGEEPENDGEDEGFQGQLRSARRIFTPYQAIGFLSKSGLIIELKIGKLDKDEFPGDEAKAHLWRCEITCGVLKGLGDSIRKVVAREMASLEFLKKLKEVFPDAKHPKFVIPDELFIDPRVFHMLEKEGLERALNICHEVKVKYNGPKEDSTFICTYFIGSDEIVGESPFQEYAKLRAAKAAYEFLTGETLSTTRYFVGDECPSEYEHSFNESEVFSVLDEGEGKADQIKKDDAPSPELLGISRGRGRGVRRQELSQQPTGPRRVVKKFCPDTSEPERPVTPLGSDFEDDDF